MIQSVRSVLFLLTFLAAAVTAQVSPVPGSGCPGAPAPATVGSPAIGQGFGIVAPPCRSGSGNEFLVLGAPRRAITIPGPIACARACNYNVDAFEVVNGRAWRVSIPNDRSLIGVVFRAQGGCVERNPAGRCIALSQAIDVRITR